MIRQSVFLPGPLPGLNEIIDARRAQRGRWNAYTTMKRRWQTQCVRIIQAAGLIPMARCTILFTWREPNRKRDPDNVVMGKKFVLDALQQAGILPNDGWRHIAAFRDRWEVDRDAPGVLVELIAEDERGEEADDVETE